MGAWSAQECERVDYDYENELRGDRGGYGNVYENGNKLIWWIIGLFGVIATTGAMAVATAVYSLKGDVAALTAKMDMLISERRYPVDRTP